MSHGLVLAYATYLALVKNSYGQPEQTRVLSRAQMHVCMSESREKHLPKACMIAKYTKTAAYAGSQKKQFETMIRITVELSGYVYAIVCI